MAEPVTTAPSLAAAHERHALLATKLHIPRPRPGLVPRPRLLARLGEGMRRELVLVCTPAGFGKTTLLADWAHAGPRPVAWLSLDEADNDPARFWRHVAAALDTVRPGVAQRVAALLGGQPALFEAMVATLVNELAAGPEELVLVLDDHIAKRGGSPRGKVLRFRHDQEGRKEATGSGSGQEGRPASALLWHRVAVGGMTSRMTTATSQESAQARTK
jgi:hypothetical protein